MQGDWDGSRIPHVGRAGFWAVTQGCWHLGAVRTWYVTPVCLEEVLACLCRLIQFNTRLSHMGHYDLIKLRMLEKP